MKKQIKIEIIKGKIRQGRIMQTDDCYLATGKQFAGKPMAKPFERPVVVIARNKYKEFAVVKIQSHKGIGLPTGLRNRVSKIMPVIEIHDNKGNPIKAGKKFRPTHPAEYLSCDSIELIINECNNPKHKQFYADNQLKLSELRNRKKKR